MYKIKVNKNKCIGCGSCCMLFPEIFEIKNGKSHVKKQFVEDKIANEIKEICPSCAIVVEKVILKKSK